jgi:hypothetical protein
MKKITMTRQKQTSVLEPAQSSVTDVNDKDGVVNHNRFPHYKIYLFVWLKLDSVNIFHNPRQCLPLLTVANWPYRYLGNSPIGSSDKQNINEQWGNLT